MWYTKRLYPALAGLLLAAGLLSACSSSPGGSGQTTPLAENVLSDVKARRDNAERAAQAERTERVSRFEEARAAILEKYGVQMPASGSDTGAGSKPGLATASSFALRPEPPAAQAAETGKKLVKKASVATSSRVAGNLTVNAPWKCVPSSLKSVVKAVSDRFGPVVVNSTYRSPKNNRRAGGARGSYHLRCQAVDFRVVKGGKGVMAYLAQFRSVGGLKRYRSGFFHIDTGPRRSWRG